VISEVDPVSRFDLADLPPGAVAIQFFQKHFGGPVLEVTNSVNDSRRNREANLRHRDFQTAPVKKDIIHRQPVRKAVQIYLQQTSETTVVFTHHSDTVQTVNGT